MKKISLWGSLASIVGLFVAFVSFNAQSGNQTTHGNQSPAIGDNKGDVTINYNNSGSKPEKMYVLRNQKAGSTLVVKEQNIKNLTDKNTHVCLAIAGTPIELLGVSSKEAGIDMWQKVNIVSGPCAGKLGWVATENISYE